MAIRIQCSKDEPGAELNEYWTKQNKREVYTRTFAVGCVVALREMNGYNDSDFYATYWSETAQKFVECEYATTRGWTYANGAWIDAPEELMQKYWAHLRAQERATKVFYLRKTRKKEQETRKRAKLTYRQWQDIRRVYGQEIAEAIFVLLGSQARNSLRSEFRKSLANQIRTWLETPREERQYKTPLSPKQIRYLV